MNEVMTNEVKKKIVYSGVQPSGNLTIGNYLGAIKNFSAFSEDYECYYCVVDLHSVTVRQVPAELIKRTYEGLAVYMACGLDPEKMYKNSANGKVNSGAFLMYSGINLTYLPCGDKQSYKVYFEEV